VRAEPGSGGSDPQTPRRVGECPPPEPPLKGFGLRRWGRHETDRLVGLWDEKIPTLIGIKYDPKHPHVAIFRLSTT
jgi:hypothetical protein